jgi:DNA-binding SARP family transcriptional activator
MINSIACNDLSSLVQSGQYKEAIAASQKYSPLSSLDKRLVGRAYWGLGDFTSAAIFLNQAVQSGEFGAAVDLLQLKVWQNPIEESEIEFGNIQHLRLVDKDAMQLQFLGGEIALRQNKLTLAKQRLQEAWVKANASNNSGSLVQAIGQSLSTVYQLLGHQPDALRVINAAIIGASGVWNVFLKINRAEILFFAGKFSESFSEIEEIQIAPDSNAQLIGFYEITKSLHVVMNNQIEAVGFLTDSLQKSSNQWFLFRGRAYLIGILISIGHLDQARGHLAKLEIQAHTPNETAMYNMRRGQYLTATGQLEQAREHLKTAQTIFYDLEWRRECGWTLLHLAHCEVLAGNAHEASGHLDMLGDLVSIIEGSAFLELERRFIGDLKPLVDCASSYGRQALDVQSAVLQKPLENRPTPRGLRLTVFGEPVLCVNGHPTPIKLNKGFEIMAYLLLYPHSNAEKIVTDLFENSKDLDAAKSYFHTARYQIMAACPYIKFPYNKITRTYTLDTSEFEIEFDYHDVAQLLHAPTENEFYQALEFCKGSFLQGFEGQWIEEVRANMEWLLVRSGLKLVQEMYETGDFQACRRLTERLLKIEPFDESLNEVLVRATKEIEGALASRKAMSKVESQFLAEVGELPPTLAQLKREIKYKMN